MNATFFATGGLAIFTFIFTIVLMIIYFTKESNKGVLSKIYLISALITSLTTLSEVISYYFMSINPTSESSLWASKIYIVFFFLMFFSYTIYTLYILLIKEENFNNPKYNKYVLLGYIISFIVATIISIIIPISCECADKICYITDPFNTIAKIAGISFAILHSTFLFFSRKKITGLNMGILLFGMISYSVFFGYTVYFHTNFSFTTFFCGITVTILFLTFENQDTLLQKRKAELQQELTNSQNAEINFITKLEQKVNYNISYIITLAETYKDKNDIEKIKQINNELILESNIIKDYISITNNEYKVNDSNYYTNDIIENLLTNNNLNINNNYSMIINQDKEINIKILNYLLLSLKDLNHLDNIDLNINIDNNNRNYINYTLSFYDINLTNEIFNITKEDLNKIDAVNNLYYIDIYNAKMLSNLINAELIFENNNGYSRYTLKIKNNTDGGVNNATL